MADDVTIKDFSGSGRVVATDEIGTRSFQKVKLAFGPDNTATDVQTGTGLPVTPQGVTETARGAGKATTGTITRVATSSGGSATLLASNVNRRGVVIYNDSLQNLYVKFNSGACSATSFTLILAPGQTLMESEMGYTGAITGILDGGSGNAQVTELT